MTPTTQTASAYLAIFATVSVFLGLVIAVGAGTHDTIMVSQAAFLLIGLQLFILVRGWVVLTRRFAHGLPQSTWFEFWRPLGISVASYAGLQGLASAIASGF